MDESKTTIVVGGPGAGKTTKLLDVVDEALASGINSRDVAFLSFSRKAAEEGRTRASQRFSIPEEELPWFRTIHSLAFRLLGMRRDRMVGWQHLKQLGAMLGLEFKGREVVDDDVYGMSSPDRMLYLQGLAINMMRPLKEVWSAANEDSINLHELERLAATYECFKQKHGLLDFNDLLIKFTASPVSQMPKFELLVIDEMQDSSPLQWECLELLAANSKTIVVGGDDRQAIYRFSGADVDRFIAMRGRQITLQQSWRIPASVHRVAEGLAARMTNKRDQSFKPREEEGSVNWFGSIEEVDLATGSWLLLARNGYMLTELEDWCLTQGFSFHSVSKDPLKSPALAAIRTWENLRRGKDESAEHVLEAIKYLRLLPAPLAKQLKSDEASKQYSMPELLKLGLGTDAVWHEALYKISPKERDFFLAARRRGEALLKEPRIRISTIHSSKGSEADHVLLLTDMSYKCYSSMNESAEGSDTENRVWYVGCTRARKTLNLILPKTNLSFEI